jgi:hypothetical protein
MRRFLALLTIAIVACSMRAVTPRVVHLYGGDANWALIESPSKVTAFRLVRPGVRTYIRAPDEMDGFEIASTPAPVDATSAREVASILADDAIYDWDRAKGCDFDPGVALRFAGSASAVDVLFCFKCNELAVYRDGQRVGGEDFDRARPRLLAVMRRVFPGDDEIGKLR